MQRLGLQWGTPGRTCARLRRPAPVYDLGRGVGGSLPGGGTAGSPGGGGGCQPGLSLLLPAGVLPERAHVVGRLEVRSWHPGVAQHLRRAAGGRGQACGSELGWARAQPGGLRSMGEDGQRAGCYGQCPLLAARLLIRRVACDEGRPSFTGARAGHARRARRGCSSIIQGTSRGACPANLVLRHA